MKNTTYKIFLTLLLATVSMTYSYSQNNYYWSNTDKISIDKSTNKSIQFSNITQFNVAINSSQEDIKLINYKKNIINVGEENLQKYIDLYQNSIFKVSDVFVTNEGLELTLFNEIICKGNPEKLEGLTQGIAYELLTKENNSRFIIKVIDKSIDILSLSNKIYESGLFEYCYPNFISEITYNSDIKQEKHKVNANKVTPNDTYFNKQFYLKNTGQVINDGHSGTAGADIKAVSAWNITKGSPSIVIAVIDEGVTSNHPDLPNSRQIRLNGSNFSGIGSVNNPSATGNGNHGNACSGIIAAEQNNGQGITGVSPESKIMPIKIFGSSTNNDIADAIEFAYINGADVISNSWGYNTSNPNLFPAIVDEIENAIANGALVVFAAGNTANHVVNNNGFVSFPANNSQINGLICVGASNRDDDQANYSPTNALVEVVAPSHNAYPSQIAGESFEVWTIDMPGANGYNPCNSGCQAPRFPGQQLPSSGINHQSYTGRMGGTSSSCPQVAAVASLLLSVNSSLSPIDLEDMIKQTADKVGGYTYFPNGRSLEMGFGRLNAYQAVLSAQSGSCPPNLTINQNVNAGQTDIQEAINSITATNVIFNNATAAYDAGSNVSLKPGFHARNGSSFRAYIDGCTTKDSEDVKTKPELTIVYKRITINKEGALKENQEIIKAYPNPVRDMLSISTDAEISSWELRNHVGKRVRHSTNKKSFTKDRINVSQLNIGFYILTVHLSDGQTIYKNIIKK